MPIRKPKPTSPGRRFVTYADFAEVTKSRAGEDPRRGPHEVRRPQRERAQDRAPPRRRRQAPVPPDRLQAPQGRRARPRRRDRVRPQPVGLHRAAALPRRREALHPRPEPAARRACSSSPAPGADITVGNALPLANMPVGTVVHNVELQPGRGGQLARSAGAGVQLMAKEGDYATLRLPSGEMRMVRAECRATVGHDRQRRPPEHHGRQGRPQAPHGRAPADARHRDEPGGPPARRRRGRHAAGQPPADALGRADDRLPHPQEGQAVRPLHRPRPPPWQEGSSR